MPVSPGAVTMTADAKAKKPRSIALHDRSKAARRVERKLK